MTKPARRAVATAIALIAVAGSQACGSPRGPGAAPPAAATGIPKALLNEARPVGVGPRFQPPAGGPVAGPCERTLGPRDGVHIEVFAENRVVLLPAGIGTRPPRAILDGRITGAHCYGTLVTLDPTGLVLTRPGTRLTVGDLFRSWGQPLSATSVASFRAPTGTRVVTFVNGRRWARSPGAVPLTRHAEIVLEVGPRVPPHRSYAFPAGT